MDRAAASTLRQWDEFWPGVPYPLRVETVAGPRQIAPGTKLDDKYRIEQLIAVGGMGAVYLGTHTGLRKRVAIKVLNPQSNEKGMLERFRREAITASQIGHEGIAQVTDFGTSVTGEHFLVMEYLEGESLAARLTTSGALPIELACELGCAILAPLGAAHEAGVVHRDLKPDNVFLVRQSRGEMVKLLDFGISRGPAFEGEFRLTKTGLVLGTPYYMSPEQARGESEIGPAADIYAFGVILYEMLVGRVPIHGENYNQLMYRVLTAEYVPPRQERPEIPEELERIILQAMAIDPAQRPATCGELERRLLDFCRPTFRDHQIERISSSSGFSLAALSAGVTAPMATAGAKTGPRDEAEAAVMLGDTVQTPVGVSSELQAPSEIQVPIEEARPPRRALWIAGAAVVLCGLVGTLVIASRGDDGGKPAPTVARPEPAPEQAPPPPPEAAPEEGARGSGAPVPAPVSVPEEIMLWFVIEPATARVELDGRVVTARELKVRKDGGVHRLRITAPGFAVHDDEVRFDVNQRLVVQLKRAGTRPRTRPPRGAPPERKPELIDPNSPYATSPSR